MMAICRQDRRGQERMVKQEVVESDQSQTQSQPRPGSRKSLCELYLDFMECLFEVSLLVHTICFFAGILLVCLSFFWPEVTVSSLRLVLQPLGLTMVVFNVTHGFVSNCARLGIKFR